MVLDGDPHSFPTRFDPGSGRSGTLPCFRAGIVRNDDRILDHEPWNGKAWNDVILFSALFFV